MSDTGWALLAALSYRHLSLQLSQLLHTLLQQEGKEQKSFSKYSGKQNAFSKSCVPAVTSSILGKPEPKEKEDSLKYNTSKATAPRPHSEPQTRQGPRRALGGAQQTPIAKRMGDSSTTASTANSTSSIFPIKRQDFQSTIQRSRSTSSWRPQQRQEPPRSNTQSLMHTQLHHCQCQPGPLSFFFPFLFFGSPSQLFYRSLYLSSTIIFQMLGGRH